MTPEEFGEIYTSFEKQLKSASTRPEAITETVVSTYILLSFKKSAQDGIMASFQDLSTSLAKVLAGQTNNINENTAQLLALIMKRLDDIEKKIDSLA